MSTFDPRFRIEAFASVHELALVVENAVANSPAEHLSRIIQERLEGAAKDVKAKLDARYGEGNP